MRNYFLALKAPEVSPLPLPMHNSFHVLKELKLTVAEIVLPAENITS